MIYRQNANFIYSFNAVLNQNGSIRFLTFLRDFDMGICWGHFFSHAPHSLQLLAA
jgi:hypothetical protein